MRSTQRALEVDQLRRLQTGARAALALGIGASLTANVLAADPSLVGKLIAAWPPIALLVTVELLFRIPTSSGVRSYLRIGAAVPIALIAAWVSYHHMVEVALAYGEATSTAVLLPFSVDGLVIVASVSLVEIARRLRSSTGQAPADRNRRAKRETAPTTGPANGSSNRAASPKRPSSDRQSGPASSTLGAEIRRTASEHPGWTQAQLADAVGCSVRTVRRHLTSAGATKDRPAAPTTGSTGNGSTAYEGAA